MLRNPRNDIHRDRAEPGKPPIIAPVINPLKPRKPMPQLVECIPNFSEARRPEVVDQIVSAIQAAMGPGDGASKKAAALKALAAALAIVEGVAEKDLLNDAEFLALADRLIELAVTLMQLHPEVEAIAARIRGLKPAA